MIGMGGGGKTGGIGFLPSPHPLPLFLSDSGLWVPGGPETKHPPPHCSSVQPQNCPLGEDFTDLCQDLVLRFKIFIIIRNYDNNHLSINSSTLRGGEGTVGREGQGG